MGDLEMYDPVEIQLLSTLILNSWAFCHYACTTILRREFQLWKFIYQHISPLFSLVYQTLGVTVVFANLTCFRGNLLLECLGGDLLHY